MLTRGKSWRLFTLCSLGSYLLLHSKDFGIREPFIIIQLHVFADKLHNSLPGSCYSWSCIYGPRKTWLVLWSDWLKNYSAMGYWNSLQGKQYNIMRTLDQTDIWKWYPKDLSSSIKLVCIPNTEYIIMLCIFHAQRQNSQLNAQSEFIHVNCITCQRICSPRLLINTPLPHYIARNMSLLFPGSA